jgi:hypothetical protein
VCWYWHLPYAALCTFLSSLLNKCGGGGGCFEKDEHSSNQCLSTERAECVYRHSWSDASSIQLTRRMLGTVYSQTYRPCSLHFLIIIKYIGPTIWTRFSLCEKQDSVILMGLLIISSLRYSLQTTLPLDFQLSEIMGCYRTIMGDSLWLCMCLTLVEYICYFRTQVFFSFFLAIT